MTLDPKAAIQIHMRWKMTFLFHIECEEPLAPTAVQQIEQERLCMLGRWLDSPETAPIRGTAEFAKAMRLHHDFHVEMMRLADLIQVGSFAQARTLLAPSSDYQRVSQALAHAIMALGRVAGRTNAVPALQG